MFLQKSDISASEIYPDISYRNLKRENNYEKMVREVNSKILKISLKINDQYPELSKYLEEMPATITVDKNAEITLRGLSIYYDSLNILLNYHIKQHPQNSTP